MRESGEDQDNINNSHKEHVDEGNNSFEEATPRMHTSNAAHDQATRDRRSCGDDGKQLFFNCLLLLCDGDVGDRAQDGVTSDAVVSRLSIRCLVKIAECALLR